VALWLARRFDMEKDAVKSIMYGGINELMNNRDYYRRSSFGSKYSEWTETGMKILMEYTLEMTQRIQDAEDTALDKRAKELVIKGLKGEKV